MSHPIALPAGFADLAPLAAIWARPTEYERSRVRWLASPADFAALYEAVMPKLEAILTMMKNCPLDGMDEAQRNLFCLTAAFAEASPHHELYGGSSTVPFSFAAERFVAGHGDVPSWKRAFS